MVAVLFTVANLVLVAISVVHGHRDHIAIHGVLLLLGAYWLWRLAPGRVAD
jgi:hypothetical protein